MLSYGKRLHLKVQLYFAPPITKTKITNKGIYGQRNGIMMDYYLAEFIWNQHSKTQNFILYIKLSRISCLILLVIEFVLN